MVSQVGYLGLGSNIGNRRRNLKSAVDLLAQRLTVISCSSVYETEPVGDIVEQRYFYNSCVKIETQLKPEDLLTLCKQIERQLGRDYEGPRYGPRLIDIDLLILGDYSYKSDALELPHSQISNRRFVLVPLLELAPDLQLNSDKVVDILNCISPNNQKVKLVGPPLC